MDEIYKRICEKLGCEPKDIVFQHSDTEDDNFVGSYRGLTVEELKYIVYNTEKLGLKPEK